MNDGVVKALRNNYSEFLSLIKLHVGINIIIADIFFQSHILQDVTAVTEKKSKADLMYYISCTELFGCHVVTYTCQ